jgi:hypothetical protein
MAVQLQRPYDGHALAGIVEATGSPSQASIATEIGAIRMACRDQLSMRAVLEPQQSRLN